MDNSVRQDAILSDKAVGAFIIVGGAGGIGGAVARRLRSRHATVLIAGRTQDRLEAAASALGTEWAVVDATDFAAVDALVQRAADQHGRVAGIVNAAGSILFSARKRKYMTTKPIIISQPMMGCRMRAQTPPPNSCTSG